MTAALAMSLVAFWQLLQLPADSRAFDVTVAQWIPSIALLTRDGTIGSFQVPWGFRLDPLSAMMILVVTGIGTLIHVYSTAYMADEPRGGVARFFCYSTCSVFSCSCSSGEQLTGDVRGLGRRGPLFLSADRVTVREEERVDAVENLHHEPHRRLGLRARRVPHLFHIRHL
jgi:hypothetical protein